jgi:hypothetical protein
MESFLEVFGKQRIKSITADREFIGAKWLAWLKEQGINYVIRLKEKGQYISNSRGKMVMAQELFRPLPIGTNITLNQRKIGKKGEVFDLDFGQNYSHKLLILFKK